MREVTKKTHERSHKKLMKEITKTREKQDKTYERSKTKLTREARQNLREKQEKNL
jgi:hypothetical protein